MKILRQSLEALAKPFSAPNDITIGYQPGKGISYWFDADPTLQPYLFVVVGTGQECPQGLLRQTIITDAGEAYHLIELLCLENLSLN